MSIYYNKYKFFLEVDRNVNGKQEKIDKTVDEDDEDIESTEYNMEDDETGTEDTDSTDTEDTDGTDSTEDEDTDDIESTEYSMEDETDTEDTDDTDSTEDTDDSESDNVEMSEDEIKQMEEELFKSVPKDQMNIKIIELKKQYLDVYNTIESILTRTNKIQKTAQNSKSLEFIINKLLELKELVKFYMTNTFETKSFIENNINYQQYLSTLNIINKLFKEIKDKKDNN